MSAPADPLAREPVSLDSLGGWPGVLSRLFARDDLTAEEAAAVLDRVLAGEAAPSQIAAFAAALRTKGETPEEMIGLARAMRARGERVEAGGDLVDTCGTGGDRSGSINVSTMAALVLAGAGARVCKHGGRAASSISGSADVLEALGVVVDLGPDGVAACIEQASIGFCLAPRFHPAMRHAAPVRRELGVATVFNFLGPLANPGRASRQMIGVGDARMSSLMCAVLEANGAERAWICHGDDGLDELSTVTTSRVLETVRRGDGTYERREFVVDPAELGLSPARPEQLRGGTAAENAAIVRAVFSGQPGPAREFALLNAAGGLVVAGLVRDLGAGLELAAEVIDDGRATAALDRLVAVSRAASG